MLLEAWAAAVQRHNNQQDRCSQRVRVKVRVSSRVRRRNAQPDR